MFGLRNTDPAERTEKYLGVSMTPAEKRRAKKGFAVVVVFMCIFMFVSLIRGCMGTGNQVTDEQLYNETISVLNENTPLGMAQVQYSKQGMTSIEEIGENLYKVTGHYFLSGGRGGSFTVKIYIHPDSKRYSYEWYVTPVR